MSARLLLALGGIAALAACDNAAPGLGAPEQPLEPAPQLVSGATAVERAFVPSIAPAAMTDAEIARVVPAARRCAFRYTEDSNPVLATDGEHGVVKINGELAALTPSQAGNAASGGVLTADDLRLTVQPLPGEDAGEVNLRSRSPAAQDCASTTATFTDARAAPSVELW